MVIGVEIYSLFKSWYHYLKYVTVSVLSIFDMLPYT